MEKNDEYVSKATFSLNEMTGVLYVKASPSKVKTVSKLIDLYNSRKLIIIKTNYKKKKNKVQRK